MRWVSKLTLTTAACALIALPSSCGDDSATSASSSTPSSSGTGGSGGGGPNPIACDGAPAELSLDGTWVAYGRLAVTLVGAPGGAVTVCPEDQVGESTLLLLLTVKQDPADKTKIAEAHATLCSIDLPVVTALVGMCNPMSETLVSTKLTAPEALLNALPKLSTGAVPGALGGLSPGASVNIERFTVTAGSQATGDALPSWKTGDQACGNVSLGHTACEAMCVDDCAAMRDDDADGFPGVTVHVCGLTPDDASKNVPCHATAPDDPGTTIQGQAFLNIEVNPKFDGTAVSSCEVSGQVDTAVLYHVIGADIFLTGAPISVTSAIMSLPTFSVDPVASKFRMVRIDGQYGAPDWQVDPAQPLEACSVLIKRVNEL